MFERMKLGGHSALDAVRRYGARRRLIGRLRPNEQLSKATYVELFFDLVFIFCMRSILPIITDVEGGVVDWYTYYTFWFTFALMLQIWFNSTIFMNRFGTGGMWDIVLLFTDMFLLFVMTQAISTGWENYAIYNICWVLITLNTAVHWVVRFRLTPSPSPALRRDTRLAVVTLVAQAVLVLLSHLLPKDPAQVMCLVALLLGFAFWRVGAQDELDEKGKEHLSERCALLMVLTFGETLIGFGNEISTDLHLFEPIMYFLLIVGMFLIYLNETINLLDLESIGGGTRFMGISAWMTFVIANVTAGFEMTSKGMTLMGMRGDVFFGASVAVYMLSFFLYTPFNKYRHPSRKWTVSRVVASLLVLFQASVVRGATQWAFGNASLTMDEIVAIANQFSIVMTVVAVLGVYVALSIDRIVVRRERRAETAALLENAGELDPLAFLT